MQPTKEVIWLEDRGNIPRIGRAIKGMSSTLPESVADDVVKKKWAKFAKPAKAEKGE